MAAGVEALIFVGLPLRRRMMLPLGHWRADQLGSNTLGLGEHAVESERMGVCPTELPEIFQRLGGWRGEKFDSELIPQSGWKSSEASKPLSSGW